MKKFPKFKTREEEAEYWMAHDTADFWSACEDVKSPLEVLPNLLSGIKKRHEKTNAISLRLYPSQIRMAKAIAGRKHVPYQAMLRHLIEEGLHRLARSE